MKITLELPDDFMVADRRCMNPFTPLCGSDKLEFQYVSWVNNEIVFVFLCADCGGLSNRHHRCGVLSVRGWSSGGNLEPYKIDVEK